MDKLVVVDIETVANVLGVSDRQVRTWVSDFGCPSTKDGRTRTFHWPAVLEWYVGFESAKQNGVAGDFSESDDPEEAEDIRAANLRKTVAEADLKQIALAKLRGEMVGIAEARVVVTRVFANMRSQLLNMAPKLSTRLAGEPDPTAMEAAIREEMEILCRDLSTGSVVGGAPEEPAEPEPATLELEASAEAALEPIADAFVAQIGATIHDFVEDYARLQS